MKGIGRGSSGELEIAGDGGALRDAGATASASASSGLAQPTLIPLAGGCSGGGGYLNANAGAAGGATVFNVNPHGGGGGGGVGRIRVNTSKVATVSKASPTASLGAIATY